MFATAVAYLKANNLNYINSVSFLTTILDFKKPREVGIFINKSSIAMIEQEMKVKDILMGIIYQIALVYLGLMI